MSTDTLQLIATIRSEVATRLATLNHDHCASEPCYVGKNWRNRSVVEEYHVTGVGVRYDGTPMKSVKKQLTESYE